MLSEVVIFVPSIARFGMDYLESQVAAAHLASLALEVPPDNMVDEDLRDELLRHAGSLGIVLRQPGDARADADPRHAARGRRDHRPAQDQDDRRDRAARWRRSPAAATAFFA